MHNKKSFSIAAGVGLVAASLFPSTDAAAAEKVVWNISIFGPPRAVTAGIESARDELAERSGGNFELKLHYGESISPAKENLDSVKIGVAEGAQYCSSYAPGKNPVMTALDLPFIPGVGDVEGTRYVHHEFYKNPHAIAEMEGWNAKPYISTVLPTYEFMGVGEPPETLESWKGLRVRALGGIGEAMRRLGAVPTTVTAPEVYTALERGIVQAASFPFSFSHGAYKLHEVSDWYTSNLKPGTVGCHYIIGLQAYNALPAEYQAMLADAEDGAYAAYKKAYEASDDEYLPLFRKMGLKDIKYTDEQREKIIQVGAQPVWDSWVEDMEGRGLPGREILDYVLKSGQEAAKRAKES